MLTAAKMSVEGELESETKAHHEAQLKVAALNKEVSHLQKVVTDEKADAQRRLAQLEGTLAAERSSLERERQRAHEAEQRAREAEANESRAEARSRAEQAAMTHLRAAMEAEQEAVGRERQRLAQVEVDALRAAKQTLEAQASLRQAEHATIEEQRAKLAAEREAVELERYRVQEAEATAMMAMKSSIQDAEALKNALATEKEAFRVERDRLQGIEAAALLAMKQNVADLAALDQYKQAEREELEALSAKLASEMRALAKEWEAVKAAEKDVLRRKTRIVEDENKCEALRDAEHAALQLVKEKLAAEKAVLDKERKRLAEVEVFLAVQQQGSRKYQRDQSGPDSVLKRQVEAQPRLPASQSSSRSKFDFQDAAAWPTGSPNAHPYSSSTSPSQHVQQQMHMTQSGPANEAVAHIKVLQRKWHAAQIEASELLSCSMRLCEETARIEQLISAN